MQVGVDTGGDVHPTWWRPTGRCQVLVGPASVPSSRARWRHGVHELAHGRPWPHALLERYAPVALVTPRACATCQIDHQDRPSLYDHLASRPEPLVDRWPFTRCGGGWRPTAQQASMSIVRGAANLSTSELAWWWCACMPLDIELRHEQAVARGWGVGHDLTCSSR